MEHFHVTCQTCVNMFPGHSTNEYLLKLEKKLKDTCFVFDIMFLAFLKKSDF